MDTTGLPHHVQKSYAHIQEHVSFQRQQYQEYIQSLPQDTIQHYQKVADSLGFHLDVPTGHIQYKRNFEPLALSYKISYIRHGKTEGNTEPRVFQGRVDYPNNQLNDIGYAQAEKAADTLDEWLDDWRPNLIVSSPLGRSVNTGSVFWTRHPNIPVVFMDAAAEMAFGSWDNAKVMDLDPCDMAHLFYMDQNTLVKAPQPHVVQPGWKDGSKTPGTIIKQESFLDVLQRAKRLLLGIYPQIVVHDFDSAHRSVLMYGHSMIGAAISMLMGHGKVVPGTHNLGFDGSLIMKNAIPTLLPPMMPNVGP